MTLPPEEDSDDEEPTLPPGVVIAGKYEIVRLIGRGGMGRVYEAMHKRLEHRVALKMLSRDVKHREAVVSRFEQEARTAVQLRGPHVAHVHDVDSLEDGSPFIVMEFLEGHDLADELAIVGKIPVGDAVLYTLDACEGMAEAHRLGIIHRDLKPANLFLTRKPAGTIVKVLDFGISKLKNGSSLVVTSSQAIFGSPHYMSPEQVRSASQVDARSDIWSLGVILYEMLAGEPPFKGQVASAIIAAIVTEDPRPLGELRPELPEALARAVMKALSREPEDRFASVEDFANAILPFAASERPLVLEPPKFESRVSRTAATVPEAPKKAARAERAAAPGLAAEPPAKPKRPGAPWILLAIGVAVAGAVALYRNRPSSEPESAPAAAPSAAPSAPPKTDDTARPRAATEAPTTPSATSSADSTPLAASSEPRPTRGTVPRSFGTDPSPAASAGGRKIRTQF